MNTLIEVYDKMLQDFGSQRELISVNYQIDAKDIGDLSEQSGLLTKRTDNTVLRLRRQLEDSYYTVLSEQLFHRIHEMKGYSEVNVTDSRRMVSVSNDCITTMHILIRDKIYLNVYFRSSDYDGALPVDLEFIARFPSLFTHFLFNHKNMDRFKELNDTMDNIFNKAIQINLMFGSLHRTS